MTYRAEIDNMFSTFHILSVSTDAAQMLFYSKQNTSYTLCDIENLKGT